MNIINPNGQITLLNHERQPVIVASLKHGLTFGANNNTMQVARLTILPTNNDLSDLFVFYQNGKMPFTHLQSKYINPQLFALYLKLLTTEKTYQEFISEIISEYFIGVLGYSLLENQLIQDY
jgi:hypothetical protein